WSAAGGRSRDAVPARGARARRPSCAASPTRKTSLRPRGSSSSHPAHRHILRWRMNGVLNRLQSHPLRPRVTVAKCLDSHRTLAFGLKLDDAENAVSHDDPIVLVDRPGSTGDLC